MNAFFAELRRRKVVRVAAAYLVAAWLVMQLVNVAAPAMELPGWVDGFILVLLAVGFAIVVVVAWMFELSAEGLKRTTALAAGAPQSPPLARTDVALIVAIAVLVGVSLFQVVRPVAAPSARPSATSDLSIAVLPFVNMSSDPEQEYFSDGLSEELLNVLAQIEQLRVAGRTSSFAFKGRNDDMRVIAGQLGVANILEGSVRKSGDRIRITAQLVSAADGYHLWSETYDRRLDDVFAVQEEIALAVAGALSVRLGVADAPVAPGRTDDVETFDDYLRARALFFRNDPGDLDRAIELYAGLLTRAPDYARARAGFARALVRRMAFSPERIDEARRDLEAIAAEGLARAPEDWSTQYANALLHQFRHEWRDAERSIERAAERAPRGNVEVLEVWSWMLTHLGRAEDALTLIEPVLAIDPLSTDASVAVQLALSALGRYADADAEYQRSLDLGIANSTVEYIALIRSIANGDAAPIESLSERLWASRFGPVAWAPGLLDASNDPQAALAEVRTLYADPANHTPIRLQTVTIYAALVGDPELALVAARGALVDGEGGVVNAIWYPGTDTMRRLPGFKDLVRDLGLVDYWRATDDWGDFCRPLGSDDFECF
jgi:TolB-like protein/Tfp pilus assembly protein PilF